jgi:pilus assembly protein CpaB
MRIVAFVMLSVAVALGAVTVWAVKSLVETRRPVAVEATASAPATAATIVVATRDLDFGDQLTPEVLREQPWPANSIPEGSFPTVDQIFEEGERRVALRAIAANEPLLASRISGFGGRATLSAVVAEGRRAVTIRINDVTGGAGFILPGDYVDVLITRPEKGMTASVENMLTDVLLENVRVLAVDQLAAESRDEPVVAKAATVEVGPEQAQKLALGGAVGTLSLALRGVTDAADGAEEREKSLDTVRADDLGPKRPKAAPTRRVSAPSNVASMRVVRGVHSETRTVVRERSR